MQRNVGYEFEIEHAMNIVTIREKLCSSSYYYCRFASPRGLRQRFVGFGGSSSCVFVIHYYRDCIPFRSNRRESFKLSQISDRFELTCKAECVHLVLL